MKSQRRHVVWVSKDGSLQCNMVAERSIRDARRDSEPYYGVIRPLWSLSRLFFFRAHGGEEVRSSFAGAGRPFVNVTGLSGISGPQGGMMEPIDGVGALSDM